MKARILFIALLVGATGLGAALRLPHLRARPMHVDEAVHAFKFDILWRSGVYEYDLNEYHGPTLYYATLPAAWLSGAPDLCNTDAALFRLVPVAFGLGLILLTGLLGDGLGRTAAVIAGLLTVVSPAMVYYSGYYIQETLLVFFTFVVIVAGWRMCQSGRTPPSAQNAKGQRALRPMSDQPGGLTPSCDQNAKCEQAPRTQTLAGASRSAGGRSAGRAGSTISASRLLWALALGAGIGLMHATKETCIIAWGCMSVAAIAALLTRQRAPLLATASRRRRPESKRQREGQGRVVESVAGRGAAPHPTLSPQGRGGGSVPHEGTPTGTGGEYDRTTTDVATGRPFLSAGAATVFFSAVVALAVSVALFSGLGSNWSGPADSVRAYATYFQRAGEGGAHVHPWYYYLHILLWWRHGAGPVWTEAFIVALAAIGLVVAVTDRGLSASHLLLLRFLAIYTVLMLVVYSAIPYKTPWCILSALQGMILLAGIGGATLLRLVSKAEPCTTNGPPAESRCPTQSQSVDSIGVAPVACKAGPVSKSPVVKRILGPFAVLVALLAGMLHLGWQAHRASSPRFCASYYNPYAYSYTVRDVEELAAQLIDLAAVFREARLPRQEHADPDTPQRDLLIKVLVPNPWPLPWYLRCFEQVGYWETVPDDPDADVILVSHTLQSELEGRRTADYAISYRGLRRDEVLCVYIRQDLWDAYVAALGTTSANAHQP